MKVSQFLAGTFFAASALAVPASPPVTETFVQVPLSGPLDWIAGPSLFPGEVIEGFHAPYDKYDRKTWSEYVLKRCKGFKATTSTIGYSAINSGTPKERAWFGYCFRGGATTPADYKRDPAGCVEDSVAYTCA